MLRDNEGTIFTATANDNWLQWDNYEGEKCSG